jgi:integrase
MAALLAFAVDHHYIEVNPAHVRLALRPDPPRKHVALEPGHLVAVWRLQRKNSGLADVTLLLGLTGLRWGELIALRPCDIVRASGEAPHREGHRGRSRPTRPPDQRRPPNRPAMGSQQETATRPAHRARRRSPGPLLLPRPGPLDLHRPRRVPDRECADAGTTTLRFYAHVTSTEHLRAAMNQYEAPIRQWLDPSGGDSGATSTPKTAPQTKLNRRQRVQYQQLSLRAAWWNRHFASPHPGPTHYEPFAGPQGSRSYSCTFRLTPAYSVRFILGPENRKC